jgi:hypothetical protein
MPVSSRLGAYLTKNLRTDKEENMIKLDSVTTFLTRKFFNRSM